MINIDEVMENPRISIGLPVFNGADYLEATLASLLAQTYPHFELIVSDNGSTDNTRHIGRAWAAKDDRVRYVYSRQNKGAAWNFNHTLDLASGEFFKWAAHDDLCAPDFLKRCVQVLDRHPDVVLCATGTRVIDAQGRFVEAYVPGLRTDSDRPTDRFRDVMLSWHRCYEIFGLMRTQVLKQTLRMGDYAMADRVLLGELALRGRFYEVPEALFMPRKHDRQSVRAHPNNCARTVWFNTQKAGQVVLPEWRLLAGFLRAVHRAPLGAADRALCYGQVGRWGLKNLGGLCRDVARAVRWTLLGGKKRTDVSFGLEQSGNAR